MTMTPDECLEILKRRYQPTAAHEADMVFALGVGTQTLTLHVHPDGLTVDPVLPVDANFTFTTWEQAIELLTGQADPIQAFMAGTLSSDGHLTSIFLLFSVFARAERTEVPD